ncbi:MULTISPECIES: hypothetical protein [unclassified Streptomyces]|uniref:hypothetical protein n=1 Tax=unclassified Streptomyces TaxID=2593676 RepID=UPI002E2DE3D9|nr:MULTISPECIES: hypothetical protein [unclassified Streptomyces]
MYESGTQRSHEVAVATLQPLTTQADPVAEALAQARALQILTAATGTMERSGERAQMVWVPAPGNQFMAVPREMLPAGYLHHEAMPAPPQRDLTPVPLIDPRAQLVLAGGVGAGAAGAGIGWGLGQAFTGIAAAGGTTAVVAGLALWLLIKLTGGSGGGATTHIHNESHVTNYNTSRWFGHSTSSSTTNNR